MKVCKAFKFDAAHFLPGYEGRCANLHGHTWNLEVELEGPIDRKTGMVLDFAKLKKTVNNLVIDRLDHTCLNDLPADFNRMPTCENILLWIADQLKPHDCYAFKLSRLRLYEGLESFAEMDFPTSDLVEGLSIKNLGVVVKV